MLFLIALLVLLDFAYFTDFAAHSGLDCDCHQFEVHNLFLQASVLHS